MKKNSASLDGSVVVSVRGGKLRIPMSLPFGNVRPLRMLPVLHKVADTFVGHFEKLAEEEGRKVSCKKGCGACCKQLVPVSEIETHWIKQVVETLPQPRRESVKDRFRSAVNRLRDAGLLEDLRSLGVQSRERRRELGLEYFAQGMDCPFLEEGACSIHAQRPISCREYLVTSPAENCSTPTSEGVNCIDVSVKVSNGVARALSVDGRSVWVPLVLALEWSEEHEENSTPRPSMEIAKSVFAHLAGDDD